MSLELIIKILKEKNIDDLQKVLNDFTNLDLTTLIIIDKDFELLAQALKNNKTITSLTISFKSGVMMELSKVLQDNETIKNVVLEGGDVITEPEMYMLKEGLDKNKSVTNLSISGAKIPFESFEILCDIIGLSKTIATLVLNDNGLSDGHFILLAQVLKNNETITNLSLCGCDEIEDEGLLALVQILENNSRIKTLNLSDNDLTGERFEFLAQMLEENSAITTLNLSGNGITDEDILRLVKVLEVNTQITSINLSRNEITDKGAALLMDFININGVAFNFSDCELSPKMQEIVNQNIETRPLPISSQEKSAQKGFYKSAETIPSPKPLGNSASKLDSQKENSLSHST